MTILLAEDTDDDVFFFDRAWRKAGAPGTLFVLPNGREVVRYLSRENKYADASAFPWPDVIFLDLKLPMLNGFEVLRWVRGQTFPKPFPILVLSGSPHENDIRTAKELGAADYLVKPIDPLDLKRRVEQISGSSAASAS
jgi:DNA-binding response OmpR family regulator